MKMKLFPILNSRLLCNNKWGYNSYYPIVEILAWKKIWSNMLHVSRSAVYMQYDV